MSVSRDDRFEVSVRDAPSWHSTFLQKARISPREWFVVVRFPHELVCLVFENPSNSVAFSEVATLVRRGTVQASFSSQCRWCGARGLERIGSGLESLSNLTHVRYFRCVRGENRETGTKIQLFPVWSLLLFCLVFLTLALRPSWFPGRAHYSQTEGR